MNEKILVVEDSPTQLVRLRQVIQKSGYEVVTARNGLEAMETFYRELPDLVISDILMPEMNGYQLCRLLKNDPNSRNIPVILLTSLDSKVDRFWGIKAGADLYVSKDAQNEKVVEAARELLDKKPKSQPVSEIATTLPPNDSVTIQVRLSSLLDQLLFDSTLANEAAKLSSVAIDGQKLAEQLFGLLGEVIDFQGVALLRFGPHDQFLETLQGEISGLGLIKKWLQRLGEDEENIGSFEVKRDKAVALAFPVFIEQEILGAVIIEVKSHPDDAWKNNCWNIMRIVASPLSSILKTLRLHEQVAASALENARLYTELKEVEIKRDDLLHMLTHDLRLPLTTIIGTLELLSDTELRESNPELITDLLVSASDASRTLNRMINDILDISKLESGDLRPSSHVINATHLAEGVIGEFNYAAQQRKSRLFNKIDDANLSFIGDSELVQRVLGNYVVNAIKYAPGSEVRIMARPVRLADYGLAEERFKQAGFDGVRVEVTDQGRGIEPQHRTHLFDKFYQIPGERKERRLSGSGLGLSFSKKAIEAQGGKVGVDSEVGKGSTFYFVLPIAP